MSNCPFLQAPACTGWTTLCNFSANNWEFRGRPHRFVNVTWTNGERWAAVFGSGAVVTKDIPALAVAVGVPAKVIKFRGDRESASDG
jgi:hypothetical protein